VRTVSGKILPSFAPTAALTVLIALSCLLAAPNATAAPDWSEGVAIPAGGRPNPYDLPSHQFRDDVNRGKIHAQEYPVEVTGALPPYRPLAYLMTADADNPLLQFLQDVVGGLTGVGSLDDFFQWLGLHPYPQPADAGVYAVPYPNGHRPDFGMGLGFIETADGQGFTFSCAECHSANLFGKTVLGLTNRFPRANELFAAATFALPSVSPALLKTYANATDGEARMFERLKKNFQSVGTKRPQVLGLDTSLSQVALSLARRAQDPDATKTDEAAAHPRPEPLAYDIADSKPAVWWNIKYKNRWLSDGSVVSGNPIFTNLIWNEIGRGGDLLELSGWLARNDGIVRELTEAVFSTEAPRFTDFFPPERLAVERAKRGEVTFNTTCAYCHGTYEKGWSLPGAATLPLADQLATLEVRYPSKTRVVDVGTDPGRYLGMRSLERGLNPLDISQKNGIVIRSQQGYVPPPLVGIWARWPYFHNNSASSLCDVLTRFRDRLAYYYAVDAKDPERDFDAECNGYPVVPQGEQAQEYQQRAVYFDTRLPGLSNTGHDEGIFMKDGQELLTSEQKSDLIVFLQTL
jgi:hypothetical protein